MFGTSNSLPFVMRFGAAYVRHDVVFKLETGTTRFYLIT